MPREGAAREPGTWLDVNVRSPAANVVTIELAGEVDVLTAPQFEKAMKSAIEQGAHHILVDLSSVEYLDSSGLGVILGGLKRLSRAGTISLLAPTANVQQVIRIVQLEKLVRIYPSELLALEAIPH